MGTIAIEMTRDEAGLCVSALADAIGASVPPSDGRPGVDYPSEWDVESEGAATACRRLIERIEARVEGSGSEGGPAMVPLFSQDIRSIVDGLDLLIAKWGAGLDADDDDTVRESSLYINHARDLIETLKSY